LLFEKCIKMAVMTCNRVLSTIAVAGLMIMASNAAREEKNMPATTTHKHTNRLIKESSPYLLQHAHNPVDWYPWGGEAFERAKKEDRPIFLSIGYSTCHWCHVMERERPFYGGTYFPPEDMYGRPGFERVLLTIADAWENRRQELVDSAANLSDFLAGLSSSAGKEKLLPEMLKGAFDHLRDTFDAANGGFGTAPKFPQPMNLSMLLCYWHREGNEQALQMVEKTLDAMVKGGIYDHIGGGFHRYSTDEHWLVPHFEKMLYDQALISKVYMQAYQVTKNEEYARVAREIFDYVLRDMTDANGGFYSAEDADSEGKEGVFYLWALEQIASILDKDEAEIFNAYYGVTMKGNFEESKSILNVTTSVEQLEKKFEKDCTTILNILTTARSKVFDERSRRIRPHRDDKVITAWNGLMVSSLAYGGAVLQEEKYIEAAECAAQFILNTLRKKGRLMRYYRDGRVVELAFLDDYAFMITALLDSYEATFDAKWLIEAKELSEEMIELFADNQEGGFFLTGKDGEKLITRAKPSSDGAIPSGNSIAALALLKVGRLTMNQHITEEGSKVLEAFSQQLEQSLAYSSAMLTALSFWLGPTQEIVIAGDADAQDTKQIVNLIRSKFLPNAVVLLHEQDNAGFEIYKIVPFIRNLVMMDGKATAYVCKNYVCNQPVNKIDDLGKMLSQNPRVN